MSRYLLVILASIIAISACSRSDERIPFTILAWQGYEEADLVSALQASPPLRSQKLDFRFVTYTTGDDMLRKYAQGKTVYDLVVVDAEYGKVMYDHGDIKPIADIPQVDKIMEEQYFPAFTDAHAPCRDQQLKDPYCVVVRWGTIGLVFNVAQRSLVTNDGFSALKAQKSIVIFDWYLPNMGQIVLWNRAIHQQQKNDNPYDASLEEVTDAMNRASPLRKSIVEFQPNLGLVIDAIMSGSSPITPGVGEWAIGKHSYDQCIKNEPISHDWAVPIQGGLIWVESLAIPAHVFDDPKRLGAAKSVIHAFATPEIQAKLAWRKAYTSHAPNQGAYERMDECQKAILHATRTTDLNEILSSPAVHFRKIPEKKDDWIQLWNRFKTAQ